ncbi:MAG: dihydropteroate synthase, partial [Vulcanimicrobiaceae bacterium]
MLPSVRATDRGALVVRGARLAWGVRTYVMGIVNVTPDSFSGDGLTDAEAAVAHGLAQLAAGADVIDVGAESTRPGYTPISIDEECARLLPVIAGLRARAPGAILSIDSFKPEVVRAAQRAGGDLINSIWGLDDDLLATARQTNAPVIIMHNKRVAIYETDVVDEVLADLERQAQRAVNAGIARERVILDPGIGFGKLPEHNLAVLAKLGRLVALGFP